MQLEMKRTIDEAPVEYEGTINGLPFYFRARHDGWFFGVGETVDAASLADVSPAGRFFRRGKWGHGRYAASRMPFSDTERIIHECAVAYLESLDPVAGP